ncbi:UDP-2,3-diacylglucosamine diphosphatase LpxI [Marivita sp. S6314]|uniref:LpxI family protein n=1 Tax=Marivita sp. S6314 TaxID=2926406 RepID=UPI001FF2B312|nr:UDP-2,3-diacylglucosamine diphosphatase LpxI [Marivita sp. S6314]MCK0151152.1 UDP-2,3-diacylglucosamine diphosphatase LpxI [Marivita sp. S6314]
MSLALICGQGRLPRLVAGAQDTRPLVCVLAGFEPDGLSADLTFHLETLGSLLADLTARGVTDVCLCGAIRRPPIDPARLDAATAPLVPRLQQALTSGDDGALRIVMTIFEEAGFRIAAAHQLLADLLPAAGVLTLKSYAPQTVLEARVGDRTVAAMGVRDTGQACVVRGDIVIAREDAAGTDAMLARLARDRNAGGGDLLSNPISTAGDMFGGLLGDASDWLSGGATPTEGGILFKAPKPGQDRRADLPVIGADTPDAVAAAGLAGIVIEANGVMVLDRARTVARCDDLGLFLWVRDKASP